MTISEKIKAARKNCGLTQEQLAEKLCVSRAAVAKWESGKGLPDVENLRALSKLLDVSIDYLLDDGTDANLLVTKEILHPDELQISGRCRCWQDAAVVKRFPDARKINQVALLHQLNKIEWWADFLTCGLYTAIWGVSHWKTWTGYYYLVDRNSQQFFVQVDAECITSTALPEKIDKSSFYIGDRKYLRIRYELV